MTSEAKIDISREAVDHLCDIHTGYLQHGTVATLQALRAELDEAEARAADYEDQIANLLPAVNREAVEQRARAVKADAERDAANALLEPAAPDLSDPVTVHANMLRGTIAKPSVEQIIHLYGVDALAKALAPVIVREAAVAEDSFADCWVRK